MFKNRAVSISALFGGIALLSYAIYTYIEQQLALLETFTYKIVGGNILNISVSQVSVEIDISFQNNSSLEIDVTSLNLNIYINNVNVATILNNTPFVVAAKTASTIPLNVNFDPSLIFSDLLGLIASAASFNDEVIIIQGTASIKSGFIYATVPVNYQTTWKQIMGT